MSIWTLSKYLRRLRIGLPFGGCGVVATAPIVAGSSPVWMSVAFSDDAATCCWFQKRRHPNSLCNLSVSNVVRFSHAAAVFDGWILPCCILIYSSLLRLDGHYPSFQQPSIRPLFDKFFWCYWKFVLEIWDSTLVFEWSNYNSCIRKVSFVISVRNKHGRILEIE